MGLGFALIQLDLTGTTLARRTASSGFATMPPTIPAPAGSSAAAGTRKLWPDKAFPTAADLDSVVADRPVWLGRVDGHASVGNSAALAAAGVDRRDRERRPAGGSRTACSSMRRWRWWNRKIPAPDAADQDRALAAAQEAMLRVGLTGAADMGTSKADWDAMRRAGEAGKLGCG